MNTGFVALPENRVSYFYTEGDKYPLLGTIKFSRLVINLVNILTLEKFLA